MALVSAHDKSSTTTNSVPEEETTKYHYKQHYATFHLKNNSFKIMLKSEWVVTGWLGDLPQHSAWGGLFLHCVTSNRELPFQNQNSTMHITMSPKAVILVRVSHILWRKCPLAFPLMSFDCSASTLWFMEVPESNRQKLQLRQNWWVSLADFLDICKAFHTVNHSAPLQIIIL